MSPMFPFNATRILCPLDRSELSNLALKYAVVGARIFKAQLTVLEAIHFEYPRYLSDELTTRVLKELDHYKASAKNDLEAHVRTLIGDALEGIPVSYHVLDLQPAQAISRIIEEANTDLLIMGTHGYSGFKHWMLGSITENMLHISNIPIFTVRQKIDDFIDTRQPSAEPEIKNILCSCDMSPASIQALQVAASLARRFEADLTAVRSSDSAESGEKEQFQKWLEENLQGYYPVSGIIRQGKAAPQVIDMAREMQSDLIVIGARHRSFGDVTVMGRTTELVLRHAPVPVLAVPFFEKMTESV
jgi:nucleotide-binding universal stress UspA family protein